MTKLDPIKPGDTFALYLDYAIDGVPEDFPATQLSSAVRDRNDTLLGELTVEAVAGTPGRFLAKALPAATVTWPVGEHYCDVKRVDAAGVVTHSETVILPIQRAQAK